jgi:hypothetical protein
MEMEYALKIGTQGHVYLPKLIRQSFGDKLKAIPNTKALVVFSESTPPEAVIASLQVIISDLRLQLHIPKSARQVFYEEEAKTKGS